MTFTEQCVLFMLHRGAIRRVVRVNRIAQHSVHSGTGCVSSKSIQYDFVEFCSVNVHAELSSLSLVPTANSSILMSWSFPLLDIHVYAERSHSSD